MKKTVFFDKNAEKELEKLDHSVRAKITILIDLLERDGVLIEPYGKKVEWNLFEMRVRVSGQWRLIYAYVPMEHIVVLSIFQKKRQKTPQSELQTAKKRLQKYL